MSYWPTVRPQIDEICNRWFDAPGCRRFFAVPSTPERLALRKTQFRFYVRDRRNLWALVQSKVPLDVKRAIWEHEKDELMFDERLGKGHVTEDDFVGISESSLLRGVKGTFHAFRDLAMTRPWLEALMASHIQERKNNGQIVAGGGVVQRMARKELRELGGTEETLDADTRVHMVADVEHTDLFEAIFDRYVTTEEIARGVIDAAQDSLAIYELMLESIATAQLELEGPGLAEDWQLKASA
jgi:hypothetical protein